MPFQVRDPCTLVHQCIPNRELQFVLYNENRPSPDPGVGRSKFNRRFKTYKTISLTFVRIYMNIRKHEYERAYIIECVYTRAVGYQIIIIVDHRSSMSIRRGVSIRWSVIVIFPEITHRMKRLFCTNAFKLLSCARIHVARAFPVRAYINKLY